MGRGWKRNRATTLVPRQSLTRQNRIKELHDLDIDRTSCTSFWANQFRVLLTAAAYVLMQEVRLRAAGTACARAQVCMLRGRLLKLGARVLVSARRVVVHLPASFPFLPAFRRVALALGAATGLTPLRKLRTQPKSHTGNGHGIPVSYILRIGLPVGRAIPFPSLHQPQLPDHNPPSTTKLGPPRPSRIMRVRP